MVGQKNPKSEKIPVINSYDPTKMPKRARTNISYAPKRKVKKYQEIVREGGSLSQVNHLLYTCDVDGETLSGIYLEGAFSGVGALHRAVVILPNGYSLTTLASADGSIPYTNNNSVLYCGWSSGDGDSMPISVKVKAQRKLRVGDAIYLVSIATATTCAQYMDATMFFKQP